MKKVFTVFLSGLIALQSLNFSIVDVLSLDELFAHAKLHKQEFGDDFFQFLVKHYGSERLEHQSHTSHKNNHDSLPFQNNLHIAITLMIVPQNDFSFQSKGFLAKKSEANFFYVAPRGNLFVSGVFQPPRTV